MALAGGERGFSDGSSQRAAKTLRCKSLDFCVHAAAFRSWLIIEQRAGRIYGVAVCSLLRTAEKQESAVVSSAL